MSFYRHTIKPETMKLGTTEHRNAGRTPEHWRNIQPNTGRTIGIPRSSGTCEEKRGRT